MYFHDVLICLQIDYLTLGGEKKAYLYFSVFIHTEFLELRKVLKSPQPEKTVFKAEGIITF